MIIVSSCLAGINCRYDGNNNEVDFVSELVKEGKAIAVCPEVMGGMDIPRIPCEIRIKDGKKRVFNKNGEDMSEHFYKGAEKALKIAEAAAADLAILKSKSPSCGSKEIYDGSFNSNIIEGMGITAELMLKNGIKVYNENDLDDIEI